jgi:hypothetical protein
MSTLGTSGILSCLDGSKCSNCGSYASAQPAGRATAAATAAAAICSSVLCLLWARPGSNQRLYHVVIINHARLPQQVDAMRCRSQHPPKQGCCLCVPLQG